MTAHSIWKNARSPAGETAHPREDVIPFFPLKGAEPVFIPQGAWGPISREFRVLFLGGTALSDTPQAMFQLGVQLLGAPLLFDLQIVFPVKRDSPMPGAAVQAAVPHQAVEVVAVRGAKVVLD